MSSKIGKQSRFGNLSNYYKKYPALHNAWSIYDITYHIAVMLSLPILSKKLTTHDSKIVFKNVRKLTIVIRIAFVMSLLFYFGMQDMSINSITATISVLLVPSLVSGFAWFAITIGSVKPDLLEAAIDVTKWLLACFAISSIAMVIALAQIVPISVTIAVSFSVFLMFLSAITYDNVDSTSTGIDPDLLRKLALTGLAKLNSDGLKTLDSEDELFVFNENIQRDIDNKD